MLSNFLTAMVEISRRIKINTAIGRAEKQEKCGAKRIFFPVFQNRLKTIAMFILAQLFTEGSFHFIL
jgi:hypothetical protein